MRGRHRRNVLLRGVGGTGRGISAKIGDFGLAVKLSDDASHMSGLFQVRAARTWKRWPRAARALSTRLLPARAPRFKSDRARSHGATHDVDLPCAWLARPPVR